MDSLYGCQGRSRLLSVSFHAEKDSTWLSERESLDVDVDSKNNSIPVLFKMFYSADRCQMRWTKENYISSDSANNCILMSNFFKVIKMKKKTVRMNWWMSKLWRNSIKRNIFLFVFVTLNKPWFKKKKWNWT